jgi:hypothetical protein
MAMRITSGGDDLLRPDPHVWLRRAIAALQRIPPPGGLCADAAINTAGNPTLYRRLWMGLIKRHSGPVMTEGIERA